MSDGTTLGEITAAWRELKAVMRDGGRPYGPAMQALDRALGEGDDEAQRVPSALAEGCRLLAHRAVTEGVNLAYVERLRQSLYAAADEIDRLARLTKAAK